jgi:hypothetical protein
MFLLGIKFISSVRSHLPLGLDTFWDVGANHLIGLLSILAERGPMLCTAKTRPRVITTKQPVDRFFYSIAGIFTIF